MILSSQSCVLLTAVEKRKIPLSVAMQIANSDDAGVQKILCDAYEDKTLRGRRLLTVRKVIEQRKVQGKRFHLGRHKVEGLQSSEALVRVYRKEADRQKLLVKKARLTEERLLFIVTAVKRLLADDNFVSLLRSESLDSLPTYLANRVHTASKS